MREWKEIILGKLIDTNKRNINRDYPHQIINYLDTGSITENKIDSLQEYKINEAPSRAKRLVENKDIIYSTVRPNQLHYGFIKNPIENLVVSTGFVTITSKKELIEPKFLYYYLTQNQTTEFLHSIAEASTSAYPSLKPSDIEALEIVLPPLPEQIAIASVLSSLDDKIDLLHRQNETLEQMAETLFKEWFVENAEEDWEETTVKDVCTVITKGTTPTTIKKSFTDSGINYIKAESITDSGTFIFEKFAYIDEETHELLKRSQIHNGDVLITIAGTIGRVTYVTKNIIPANTNQAIGIMRPNQQIINTYFLYCLFKSREIREDFDSRIVHAVQPNLSLGEIGSIQFRLPPKDYFNNRMKKIEKLFIKKNHNQLQIQSLTQLRDTLLPKLMSGEVKVKFK